jgi:hypothetical protein
MHGMRTMRGVGAVAGVAAAVMVLAGCGSDGGEDAVGASPSPSVTVSSEPSETVLPEETEPEYPPGPEGEIDKRADEQGWTYDSLYASASAFVQDICESLPVSAKDSASRPQWLAESGVMAGDGGAILSFGVPKLCPKWSGTVKQAVSGDYERWYGVGDYEVKEHPAAFDPSGESDVLEMAPGTYRARGEFEDCYWERTSQSGDIIDNQFVTQARTLTVTVRAGELFKNECGVFKPVS